MAIRCPVIRAGFQTETLPTAPTLCNVKDGDGRFYEATNIEALNALEDALSRCTLTARDPTTCQEVACVPVQ